MAEEIPLIPAVPPKLREAAIRGTLIPFVGAGASRLAGCPTWAQFADRALQGFVDGRKFSYGQLDQIRHLTPRIKLSIAQSLQAEHKVPIDYAAIIDPEGGYDNEIGRRLYGALAQLGQTFVTTNYDTWLDRELTSSKPPSVTVGQQLTAPATPTNRRVFHNPNDFTLANLNQPKTVFHLHGSLSNPSSMVITTRDYITRYANDRRADDPMKENRTLTFLDHLFSKKTVLFVGYGVDELEILEYVIQKGRMLHEGGEAEAKHFMLQGFYAHEYELMRSMTQYYKQCDVELLPFRKD
jgi:SIR2-like protein